MGHSCFLLRGKSTKLVTDPFGDSVGWRQTKVSPDIVTISHSHNDHSDLSRVEGEPIIINGPGEYEIKEVSILGITAWHDNKQGELRGKNTIYTIDFEDLRICHLGDLGHQLTKKQLGLLDGVDILMIPVGGIYTLPPEEAMEVVKQIEPSLVIPMHFRVSGMNKTFNKIAKLDDFLKLASVQNIRKEGKLTIKKTDLPEEMEIVVLERKQ